MVRFFVYFIFLASASGSKTAYYSTSTDVSQDSYKSKDDSTSAAWLVVPMLIVFGVFSYPYIVDSFYKYKEILRGQLVDKIRSKSTSFEEIKAFIAANPGMVWNSELNDCLVVALVEKRNDLVNFFLEETSLIDFELRDVYRNNYLHKLVNFSGVIFMKKILSIMNHNLLNERNSFGQTPLHSAVLCQNVDIVVLFLVSGADRTIVDNNNKTPYALAKSYKLEAIEGILNKSHFFLLEKYKYLLDKKGRHGSRKLV